MNPQRGTPPLPPSWIGPAVLAAAAVAFLWLIFPVVDFRSGLVSWDLEGHLLRARYWMNDVSVRGGFTAWFPYWHGGFPMAEVYPPLSAWILAALIKIGAAGWGARALLAAVWFSALPISYRFLRAAGASPAAAALGASLVLGLNADWTFGAFSAVTLGLLPNALGFVFAIATLSALQRLLTRGGKGKAAVAALGGLTILAHPFSAYWLALAGAVMTGAACFSDDEVPLDDALIAGAWAAGIGAFYWVPFAANRANILVTDPFMGRTVLGAVKHLVSLERMGGPAAGALAIGGWIALGRSGHRPRFFLFTTLAALTFSLASGALAGLLPFAKSFGQSQWARFDGFFGWTALMSTAFVWDALFDSEWGRRRAGAAAGAALAITAVVALRGAVDNRSHLSSVTPGAAVQARAISRALTDLRRPGDFILSENNDTVVAALGSPHFLNQRLPSMDRFVWDQSGSLPEGTSGSVGFLVMSQSFADEAPTAEALGRGGIRFIATLSPAARRTFERAPGFARRWPGDDAAADRFALFESTGPRRTFGLPAELSARVSGVNFTGRDGYVIGFASGTAAAYPIGTALSFHPWLRAEAGGAEIATGSGTENRLVLRSGPSTLSELRVRYVPPGWFFPLRAAALALLALALAAWARFSFARRRAS